MIDRADVFPGTIRSFFAWLVAWAQAKAIAHGVSARVLIGLSVFSIIPFYAGIFLILWGSGIGILTLQAVLHFNFHDLDFGSRASVAGLLMNRIAWALPYLYIEFFGRHLRWYFHLGVWLWMSLATICIFL